LFLTIPLATMPKLCEISQLTCNPSTIPIPPPKFTAVPKFTIEPLRIVPAPSIPVPSPPLNCGRRL
jgi:hypothetical protein